MIYIVSNYVKKRDEYGVVTYSTAATAFMAMLCLYTFISITALVLLEFEINAKGGNIKTYLDAFWVLQMSASTIGFGDYYPVTQIGRWLVAATFYVGMGIAGFIGASIAEKVIGFTNTEVKNRELRKQNAEIIEQNKEIRQQLDVLMKIVTEKNG